MRKVSELILRDSTIREEERKRRRRRRKETVLSVAAVVLVVIVRQESEERRGAAGPPPPPPAAVSCRKQDSHTRTGLDDWLGSRCFLSEHGPHTTKPHFLQWWRRLTGVNLTFWQRMHTVASESGTHTAACSPVAALPLFCSRSSTHFPMWFIHSDFSVAVAAYTAKDLVGVLMSQPLRRSPSSGTVSMVTPSSGMMCCLLYFFFWITMLPYTRMSLKRKNCRALGFLRHSLVSTPSPISTRPGMTSGWPAAPKQPSTTPMRLELASLLASRSTIFTWREH
ncbi:hypothetical protein EYF80_052870 [Liparis tanakae]|uniref:Uncharacterized protein n=1 Tax=Liparis tanakae TaxID=230148 RepID=A0A4Z2F6S6_9TELE|nr:hypothetical protein EYF80_052870 [Liparis tanakae]